LMRAISEANITVLYSHFAREALVLIALQVVV